MICFFLVLLCFVCFAQCKNFKAKLITLIKFQNSKQMLKTSTELCTCVCGFVGVVGAAAGWDCLRAIATWQSTNASDKACVYVNFNSREIYEFRAHHLSLSFSLARSLILTRSLYFLLSHSLALALTIAARLPFDLFTSIHHRLQCNFSFFHLN